MAEPIVRIRELVKEYRRDAEVVRVLDGLSLEIAAGDFVALMGPSGSGKSTLLNLIGGLDRPTSGALEVDGLRVDQLGGGALARWRADHVGFVFQIYNLLPVLTAERNVELPLLLKDLTREQRNRRVAAALEAGRPLGPGKAPSARALGRAGAARRHRAGHRHRSRRCCSATSRPATSTASRATRSSTCCRRSTASTARRSSW